jgi:predicted Zn-dependent protease
LERPVWAAQDALRRYNFEEALAHLEKRFSRWPGRADVALLAARTARRAGAYQKAEHYLEIYKRSGAADPNTATLEWSLLHCQTGDLLPTVEPYLASQLEKDPKDAALILEALARGLFLQMRYPDALDCVRRCLEREPENGQALLLQGLIFERLNRMGDALDSYRRLVELYPEHWDGQLLLAGGLLAGGEGEEAAGRFQMLWRQRPDDPAVLLGLATCHAEAGRRKEARELLDRLLAADPNRAPALMERGRLALEMENPAEAEPWLQKALAHNPSDGRPINSSMFACGNKEKRRPRPSSRPA